MTSTAILSDSRRLHRFRLTGGTDLFGDPLTVVIAVDGSVVTVVTLMGV